MFKFMKDELKVTGFSTFMLFAIPAVLALAAIWWLAFGEGLHYFTRELDQEKRHAIAVGAEVLPKEPIQVKIHTERNASLTVTKAEIDGDKLWAYVSNQGQSTIQYGRLWWNLIAPDGTVVNGGAWYIISLGGPQFIRPGQTAEINTTIKGDPRAVAIEVGVEGER